MGAVAADAVQFTVTVPFDVVGTVTPVGGARLATDAAATAADGCPIGPDAACEADRTNNDGGR